MSLKKQFKDELKRSKKLKKEQAKRQIDEQCLSRTDEEWRIIDEYLSDLLISLVAEGIETHKKDGYVWDYGLFFNKKCIEFDVSNEGSYLNSPKDKDGNAIYLQEGKQLIIGQKDIKRFCKEHKFKLRYGYYDEWKNTYNYDGLICYRIII